MRTLNQMVQEQLHHYDQRGHKIEPKPPVQRLSPHSFELIDPFGVLLQTPESYDEDVVSAKRLGRVSYTHQDQKHEALIRADTTSVRDVATRMVFCSPLDWINDIHTRVEYEIEDGFSRSSSSEDDDDVGHVYRSSSSSEEDSEEMPWAEEDDGTSRELGFFFSAFATAQEGHSVADTFGVGEEAQNDADAVEQETYEKGYVQWKRSVTPSIKICAPRKRTRLTHREPSLTDITEDASSPPSAQPPHVSKRRRKWQ